ncbi:MAG: phosphoribosylglycinamide formyltransferase [Pseudomonadota bacterium]
MNKRTANRKRVDVLASGRGTNLAALVEAASDPQFPAEINRVISNNPDVGALDIAKDNGISALVLDHRDYDDRQSHEEAISEILDDDRPDFICLAGYMRILSPDFVRRYMGRVLNIHPSLLPSFRGIDTHERALSEGVRVHGASVHFVTEKLDEGPLIAQVTVPVLASDTAETLGARVLEQEHILYPHALALVATGSVRMSGGRAVFDPSTDKAMGNSVNGALFSPGFAG